MGKLLTMNMHSVRAGIIFSMSEQYKTHFKFKIEIFWTKGAYHLDGGQCLLLFNAFIVWSRRVDLVLDIISKLSPNLHVYISHTVCFQLQNS